MSEEQQILKQPLDWVQARLGFTPDLWQAEFLQGVADGKWESVIMNCSRQSGKSEILAILALWMALARPNSLILIVAKQRQANEDIKKVRRWLTILKKSLGRKYKGKVVITNMTENKTEFEFANGSRIIGLPDSPDSIRGYSAPVLVIIDEAGMQSDDVFVAVKPMLAVSHGVMVLASTPKGTRGFFCKEYKTNPNYKKFEIPWKECPRIKKEFIEDERLRYGDLFIAQEYECQFVDAISSLFTEQEIMGGMDSGEFAIDVSDLLKPVEGETYL